MTTTDNTRMAYVAREPGKPGAVAYINAETVDIQLSQELIDSWVERGLTVQKVTLAEAMGELSRYTAARLMQQPTIEDNLATLVRVNRGEELPAFLRKQAD